MEREGQTSPGAAPKVNTNILKCSLQLLLTHPEQGENELPLFALLFLPASKLPKSKKQKKNHQSFFFFPTDSFTPFLHPFIPKKSDYFRECLAYQIMDWSPLPPSWSNKTLFKVREILNRIPAFGF